MQPDRCEPVGRSTPTEVLAELVRAGEPVEWVAQQYDLTLEQVLDALEYERQHAARRRLGPTPAPLLRG